MVMSARGLLPTAAGNSNTLTPSNVDQLASLSGLMAGLQSTQITAAGQAAAASATAAGAAAEATAYGAAGGVARENEQIAGVAGDIAVFQQQREVAKTAGQASAAGAAGGVTQGGNVLDVMQSSYQQGAVGAQLIGVQTALEQGGYEEAAVASDAEVTAANAQAAAAQAESAAFTSQASLAAQQTSQLQSLYGPQLSQVANATANPTSAAPAPSVIKGGFQGISFTVHGLNSPAGL